MAYTSIELKQDGNDPSKQWVQLWDQSGHLNQFTVTPAQVSQLQQAGVKSSTEVNNPLYYLKGPLDINAIISATTQPDREGDILDPNNHFYNDPMSIGGRQLIQTLQTAITAPVRTPTKITDPNNHEGDPNWVKVPVGPGFGWVPKGSAGDLLNKGQAGDATSQAQYDQLLAAQNAKDAATRDLTGGGTGTGTGTDASGGGSSSSSSSSSFLDVIANNLATKPPVIENGSIEANLAKYLEQAKTEVDPYYHQLISQTQQDLTRGLTQIGEDVASNERKLGQQYGVNLENTQEAMARRGLTNSSIRNTAEKTLAQNTQEAIDAGRQEALRRAQTLGTTAERSLGTTNLPTNLPTLTGAPTPITNTPGVYGTSAGTGTRDLYTSTPDTFGTLQADQATAEQKRQRDLASAQQTLQANYTM